MMDVLPLILLLVMGVVISTTCGKYTSESQNINNNTSEISTTDALIIDNDHPEQLKHANEAIDGAANDAVNLDEKFVAPDSSSSYVQMKRQLSAQSSSLADPSHISQSMQNRRLMASLVANNPSNRWPPPPSPAIPVAKPKHREYTEHHNHDNQNHRNHNHHKHLTQRYSDSQLHASAVTSNTAYQSDGQYYRPYYLTRVMLSNSSVTCNDGTVAGYYIRQNYASRRWIVFLEGGWYCFSAVTCHQRWLKMRGLMTSAHWPEAKSVGGILSSSRDENPHYWNASHVYIPYCSSDIWSGDSPAKAPGDLSFLGSRIVEQVIRELLPRGLSDASLLLLAGSSAGAAGVMINLDRVTHLLTNEGSKAQVRGIADSGWILDNEPFNNNLHNNNHNKKPCIDAINCAPMDGIKTAFKMWSSRVPSACAIHYPLEPWRCIFGYRLYPTLKTPLFIFQWLYDEAQMHIDGLSLSHSQQQFKYIHSLGRQLRSTLENVSAVFAPSCVSHCVLTKPDWRSISINGVKLTDAIRCWEQSCSHTTNDYTHKTVINRHSVDYYSSTGMSNDTVLMNDWPHNYYRKPESKQKKKRRKHNRRRHKTKRDQILLNDNISNNNNNTNNNKSTGIVGAIHQHRQHNNNNNHQSHHHQHRIQAHRDQCHHWLVDDCQWPQCNRELST
ncbi:palmitoleoyl-protein carboxylesterase NOTUM-like [Oppia nitens]|uniref:palmitoleoyl-protein carboxylesterase NOTUM-like n=1 Tax=Oppia nitens TaxID=1686743 RepID=UPI0023D9DFD5|nr:palmitoleoyl-protein carboxylesterase NOTUM-like [Oppia nitens]